MFGRQRWAADNITKSTSNSQCSPTREIFIVISGESLYLLSRVKRLAQRIASDLKKSKVSAVYNSELARVFPKTMSAKELQERIRRFAIKYGFDVDIFEVGLCAIFEKTVLRMAGPAVGNRRERKRSSGKKPSATNVTGGGGSVALSARNQRRRSKAKK